MSRRVEDVIAAARRREDELTAQDRAQQAENERANAEARARIDADIEARRASDRARIEREQAAQRETDERQLRALLLAQFRAGNPSASDEDFARVYPQLRDEYMRRQMAEADAAMRGQYANII